MLESPQAFDLRDTMQRLAVLVPRLSFNNRSFAILDAAPAWKVCRKNLGSWINAIKYWL